jgi:hypothetical protein
LIENEQRADMTFWDKARGVVALKTELEQERAAALSLRQWERALADLGLPIGKNVLSSYLFAVERLVPLGPAVATLSRNDVRGYLQPRFRTLGRLAQKFGLGETVLYAYTLDPVMQRFAEIYRATQTFAAAELAEEGDIALAQTLQIAVPTLQAMLALLDQSPELTVTELRTRTAGITFAAPIRTVPAAEPSHERDASTDHDPGTVSPGDGQRDPAGPDHSSTDAVPVRGEFVLRLESVCEKDRDNAPPKHIGQEQHALAVRMMRGRVAPAWCHQGSGARDARCNNRRMPPTFALGRSRSKKTRDRDIRGGRCRSAVQ